MEGLDLPQYRDLEFGEEVTEETELEGDEGGREGRQGRQEKGEEADREGREETEEEGGERWCSVRLEKEGEPEASSDGGQGEEGREVEEQDRKSLHQEDEGNHLEIRQWRGATREGEVERKKGEGRDREGRIEGVDGRRGVGEVTMRTTVLHEGGGEGTEV